MIKNIVAIFFLFSSLFCSERTAQRESGSSEPAQVSYLGNCEKELFAPLRSGETPASQEGVLQIDLTTYEKGIYSFHGEDGIIAQIFELIPPSSRRFVVEFGAGDGITRSNSYLLRLQGWNCLLMDRTHEILEYKLYSEFVNADNINQLFAKYLVPDEPDLLCIDNYNEFYVWKNLDPKYQPKVIMIKHNATHLPYEDKVAKYRPYYCGDDTNYFGASILAMYNLGRSKGYSLIYAENVGVNLFFVRDDLLQKSRLQFKNANNIEKLYRYPAYGKGPNGGHREDTKHRPYLTSGEVLCGR